MFRVVGGADAAGWFVQHEVPRRFTGLQGLPVEFDAIERTHFIMRVADDLPIHLNALFDQQQANLLAVQLRQIAQETV